MQNVRIEKVTVNIGVGQPGERLDNAEKLLEEITGAKPVRTLAKKRNPVFKLRKGLPIGVKVTLRKDKAVEFLKKAFAAVKNKIKRSNFDNNGNLSFGIKEYIDFPGVKYKPEIGMFGFDVCITLEKPGYRVKKRKIASSRVGKKQKVRVDEAIEFIKSMFNVEVE